MTRRRTVLAGLGALVAGCTAPRSGNRSTDSPSGSPPSPGTPTPGSGGTVAPASITAGYPHLRASGNRVVAGAGSIPAAEPIECSLPGTPQWLTALPTAAGSRWAVVDDSETLSVVSVSDGTASVVATDTWPVERPAVLSDDGAEPSVAVPPPGAGSHTLPLILDDGVAAVGTEGDLVVARGESTTRVPAALLADARLCRLDDRRVVALGGPTTRYDHGALGDGVEATEIVVLDVDGPAVVRRIPIRDGRVVEGIAPIVTDLGGERAIVVTESDARDGARLAAYAPDGRRLAVGDPIGTGFRWRHQLAVAPFGPDGERELAVVKTPHVGGTVEFYRRAGDRLELVATLANAASHTFGSRNLDGGVALDGDGDGRTELLVPDDERRRLRAIERRGDSAVAEWTVSVGGSLSTNVVGVPHGEGVAVGVGHDGDTLRVWV